VTVTAGDGTYSASQTFAWTVAPAVTVSDPGPQSNTEGNAVAVTLTATDTTGGTPRSSAEQKKAEKGDAALFHPEIP
jgi:hypothetical protein